MSRRRKLIITIDGPAGTGKSTAARHLARHLRYLYLDTGAMYRAIGLKALRRKVSLNDPHALTRLAEHSRITLHPAQGGGVRTSLDAKDVSQAIRRPEVSEAASKVAAVPGVRRALVRLQRRIGRAGGVVAEGRDTGTVVFPQADWKVYLTASLAERSRRRYKELRAAGLPVKLSEVRKETAERDRRDQTRKHSPLRPAKGAIYIDNTRLKSEQVFAKLLAYVRKSKVYASSDRRTI